MWCSATPPSRWGCPRGSSAEATPATPKCLPTDSRPATARRVGRPGDRAGHPGLRRPPTALRRQRAAVARHVLFRRRTHRRSAGPAARRVTLRAGAGSGTAWRRPAPPRPSRWSAPAPAEAQWLAIAHRKPLLAITRVTRDSTGDALRVTPTTCSAPTGSGLATARSARSAISRRRLISPACAAGAPDPA